MTKIKWYSFAEAIPPYSSAKILVLDRTKESLDKSRNDFYVTQDYKGLMGSKNMNSQSTFWSYFDDPED